MPLNDGQAVEKYVKSMISLQNTNPDALKKVQMNHYRWIGCNKLE